MECHDVAGGFLGQRRAHSSVVSLQAGAHFRHGDPGDSAVDLLGVDRRRRLGDVVLFYPV